MHNFLRSTVAATLLGACGLMPDSAAPTAIAAPAATPAEAPVNPSLDWGPTGRGLFIYHNVRGDCTWLEHAHGRNGAWGLWRMPLDAVLHTRPEVVDGTGDAVRFACSDGSACIEAGAFHRTPDRTDAHTIPFETRTGAENYLSQVASLRKACRALK